MRRRAVDLEFEEPGLLRFVLDDQFTPAVWLNIKQEIERFRILDKDVLIGLLGSLLELFPERADDLGIDDDLTDWLCADLQRGSLLDPVWSSRYSVLRRLAPEKINQVIIDKAEQQWLGLVEQADTTSRY